MKRIIVLLLSALMVLSVLSGCDNKKNNSDNKLKVVTTIFPIYDWVREVLGDVDVDVEVLFNNGVDLHSYQPSIKDIAKINNADVFMYVGGESDEWVEDALKNLDKNVKVINLMEVLGEDVKNEEIVEGMEDDHDHSKEVSTFKDDEVEDRSLSDWNGEWQSAYPFALDGTLDKAFESMAKDGETSADEYKTYYLNGYKTDIASIEIKGDHIDFTYNDGAKVGSDYKYVGYYIQNWSTGTKAAMYRFEAENMDTDAPKYIEFNDHMIEPANAEHFQIRMSNESFDAIVDPENSWPTFFPMDMDGEEICEHLEGHDGHESDGEESDEHIWLSLRNAKKCIEAIKDVLCELDPTNMDRYKKNAEEYIEKLELLDQKYMEVVDKAKNDTLVFGDRFPFRYLVDDYNLNYYAAFVGCSTESEASFNTITFLAKKLDELGLTSILTTEGNNHKIAKTIIKNTVNKNQEILTLNSMQGGILEGYTYLSIMENNLEVLKRALN